MYYIIIIIPVEDECAHVYGLGILFIEHIFTRKVWVEAIGEVFTPNGKILLISSVDEYKKHQIYHLFPHAPLGGRGVPSGSVIIII